MFKNEEGFSLLELVVAVGVAGIIAAVALPTFAGIQGTARTTSSTYAASASAAEAQANALLSDTGSGSASSSSSSASVTVSNSTDLATINPGNEWAAGWAFTWYVQAYENNIILGNAGETTTDYYSFTSQDKEMKQMVHIQGLDSAKASAIAAAIDAGASTITVDGTVYPIASTKSLVWNGSVYVVTVAKYEVQNHNYSNGKNVIVYINGGLTNGYSYNPSTVTVG